MENFITQIRKKYVFSPIIKDNTFCMGKKDDCWSLIEKGFTRLDYKTKSNIETLYLTIKPTLKNITETNNLSFLSKDINYLWIPLPLLKFLERNEHFISLKNLVVENKELYIKNEKCFSDFIFSNACFLNNLRSLVFVGDSNLSGEYWHNLNINIEQFSNIEYFSTVLDSKDKIIERISILENLKHLDISNIVSSTILDYLTKIKLESLSISNLFADFNFENLEKIQSIEILKINNSKSIFDCAILKKLPLLKEVSLLGIKKIINTDVLLEIKTLKNLTIINSANKMKKVDKNNFINHGFDILNIDYM
jgi:hypothetical protein